MQEGTVPGLVQELVRTDVRHGTAVLLQSARLQDWWRVLDWRASVECGISVECELPGLVQSVGPEHYGRVQASGCRVWTGAECGAGVECMDAELQN